MAASVRSPSAVQLPLQVGLLSTLIACASAPPLAERPEVSHTDDDAFALAHRLVTAFGYDRLPQVAQLNFRQVFLVGERRIFSAQHHWDLENQRDRMVWRSPDGHTYDAVLHLRTGIVYGYVDGVEAVGPDQLKLASLARHRFLTDTRYLVMPMRLFDPRAHLVRAGPERVDGQSYEVLELHPTSGEGTTVRLFVDPTGLRVRRSERADGADPGSHRVTTWGAYRPVGPLLLAHEHQLSTEGHRSVLEDVIALRDVDHEALLPTAAR